jgi:hypothetical protein
VLSIIVFGSIAYVLSSKTKGRVQADALSDDATPPSGGQQDAGSIDPASVQRGGGLRSRLPGAEDRGPVG